MSEITIEIGVSNFSVEERNIITAIFLENEVIGVYAKQLLVYFIERGVIDGSINVVDGKKVAVPTTTYEALKGDISFNDMLDLTIATNFSADIIPSYGLSDRKIYFAKKRQLRLYALSRKFSALLQHQIVENHRNGLLRKVRELKKLIITHFELPTSTQYDEFKSCDDISTELESKMSALSTRNRKKKAEEKKDEVSDVTGDSFGLNDTTDSILTEESETLDNMVTPPPPRPNRYIPHQRVDPLELMEDPEIYDLVRGKIVTDLLQGRIGVVIKLDSIKRAIIRDATISEVEYNTFTVDTYAEIALSPNSDLYVEEDMDDTEY